MIIEGQGYDPNQINTLKNNLQFLTQPDSSEIGLSGGGGFLGGTSVSGGGVSSGSGSFSSTPSSKPPSGFTGSIFDRSQGTTGGGLLSSLSSARQGQTGRIQDLSSGFRQAAGPSVTYGSLGGSGTIERGLSPGSDTSAITNMLGYQYTGPTQLDPKEAADVSLKSGELSSRAGALTSGLGLQSTLLQGIGGLTPGQAQYEAQKLRYDPDFQRKAQSELENVRKLNSLFASSQKEAQELAQTRQREAGDIRERTSGYLTTKQSGILGGVKEEADRRNLQRQRVIDLFDQIRKAETIADTPEEFLGGVGQEFMGGYSKSQEAQAALQKILQDPYYSSISDYGLLAPKLTKAGREWYSAPDGEGEVDIRKWVKQQKRAAETPEEKKAWGDRYRLLLQRQADVNRLFKTLTPKQEKARGGQGEYAYYLPSGTGLGLGAWQPTDFQPYLQLEAGNAATPENVATDEQARIVNLIHELLGRNQRLGRGTVPFLPANIFADVAGFQEDEARSLEERGKQLEEMASTFKKRRQSARKRYHKKRATSGSWAFPSDLEVGPMKTSTFQPIFSTSYGLGGIGQGAGMIGLY